MTAETGRSSERNSELTRCSGSDAIDAARLSRNSRISLPAAHLIDLVTTGIEGVVESLHVEPYTSFKKPSGKAPWLEERGRRWSTCRIYAATVVWSKYFESALILIILFNVGLIMFETDQEAKCYPKFKTDLDACPTSHTNIQWLKIANDVLLVAYTIEALVTMFALRCMYVRSPLYMLDLILCALSWFPYLGVNLVNVMWLRVFRVCRVLKAAKLKKMFALVPELNLLLGAFTSSMKVMFSGAFILLALLFFFSILTVQFVHPTNSEIKYEDCERCARGFQSIFDSMLTLYKQVVAGDSWGEISIPVVENSNTGILLLVIHLVIALGAMNLILGVIVEQAMEVRECNQSAQAEKVAETRRLRKMQLLDVVRAMDADKSGDIDREEIGTCVRTDVDMQARLSLAGVRLSDVEEIVQSLTSTGKGNTISYESFCNVFDDIEAADLRKTVVMTKLLVTSMHRDLSERLDQQGHSLTTISGMMSRMIDLRRPASPPGDTHEIHAQPCADTNERERTLTSLPCTPRHHHCPHTFSPCDFDFRLGKSVTEAIMSCKAAIDSGNESVQQSLMRIDTEWVASLSALEEALISCVDSQKLHGFTARLLDHVMRTHQTLERRRRNFCQDFVNALENDFNLWVSLCSILDAIGITHAEYKLDHYAELIHSARSPRTKWNQLMAETVPQTP